MLSVLRVVDIGRHVRAGGSVPSAGVLGPIGTSLTRLLFMANQLLSVNNKLHSLRGKSHYLGIIEGSAISIVMCGEMTCLFNRADRANKKNKT